MRTITAILRVVSCQNLKNRMDVRREKCIVPPPCSRIVERIKFEKDPVTQDN